MSSVVKLRNGSVFTEPLAKTLEPLQFRLKDSDQKATAFPMFLPNDVPESLVEYLHGLLNKELEAGQTYPHVGPLTKEEFLNLWFHSFAVVVLDTEERSINKDWTNWDQLVMGTFYIKPNYVGRCSHNCNAGFLVNPAFRGRKIGYRLGQVYLTWAPLLGYKYSVFNLVFVTNPASWKIWDRLKFSRIGYIPGAAVLKGHEDPVDAIMYGKDLTSVEAELFDDFQLN